MGDRANVQVHEGEEAGVFLYTHWNGTELPGVVQKVLASEMGRRRANDGPYLARIVFDAMTAKEHGNETGHGIWTSAPDGEDRTISLDTRNMVVVASGGRWSFEEFATLKDLGSVFRR